MALLAMLAVAGEKGCSRHKLAGCLWPESDERLALHSLSDSLYLIRRVVGDGGVVAAGKILHLDPQIVRSDVSAFQDALANQALEEAADLYGGPFLDGFYVSGALELERWIDRERLRLANLYEEALESLAQRAEESGDRAAVVGWWRRLAAHDSLNSRFASRLVEALAAAGDPANALQHVQQHVSLLRDELGVEAPPDILSLAEQLLSEQASRDQASLEVEPVAGPRETPPEAAAPREPPVVTKQLVRAGRPTTRWRTALVGAVSALTVLAVSWLFLQRGGEPRLIEVAASPEPADRVTLVVLPFRNLGVPEDQYFADGITEEIRARLTQVSGLAVIAARSSNEYAETEKTSGQIGEELGAEFILNASVHWGHLAGDSIRLRVVAQLVRASDETNVWANIYNGDLADVFDVQSDIALQVSRNIGLILPSSERHALETNPTDNAQAYEYYLQGQEYAVRGGPENREIAIQMYERAIGLDPDFALAYAAMSTTHSWFYHYEVDVTPERVALARAAVDRALEIDPDLPGARVALGYYYYYCFKDYDNALAQFEIAQRSFNRPIAGIAWVERRRGNWERAARLVEERVETYDPRNYAFTEELGFMYLRLRDYSKSEKYNTRSASLRPEYVHGYLNNAWVHLMRDGDTEGARNVILDMVERSGVAITANSRTLRAWILIELAEGRYQEALDSMAAAQSKILDADGVFYYPKALVHAQILVLMGTEEEAYSYFDSARVVLESDLIAYPDDARVHSALGIAYAGLGHSEEAIAEGLRGLELMPMAQDAHIGAFRVEDLATIYAMTGDYDAAIDQLDYLLSIPSEISVALIRIDPKWNPLRGQERFQALLRRYE